MPTTFTKLNETWNAEPNIPNVDLRTEGRNLIVSFALNPFLYPEFSNLDRGELVFENCWRYRLGPTNDEGWWKNQCRFSSSVSDWGEFYEVRGDLKLDVLPEESWILSGEPPSDTRHFLFYFRDHTFECDAASWQFRVIRANR
jgi:hypothetical protein